MILLGEPGSTGTAGAIGVDLVCSSVGDKVNSVHGSWTLNWEFLAVMIEPALAFATKWMA